MVKLSIIIVNFNAGEFIVDCLSSVFKNNDKEIIDKDFEIIVVDNHSKDGSINKLKKFKNITLITNDNNLGFSKANNIGVSKASGEFVLFLNPDTIVPPLTLQGMLNFLQKNEAIGAATCKIILKNGHEDNDAHRGFPTPWNSFTQFSGLSKIFPHNKFFAGYYQGQKNYDKETEIDCLSGAFMIVRKKAGKEVGWWDEDYFFYGEDIEFCWQLKEKGWKVMYVPDFYIKHIKGIASGIKRMSKELSSADKESKKNATIARFNAMKIFYKKHYEGKYNLLVNLLVKMAINIKLFWALNF